MSEITLDPKDLTQKEVHGHLLTAIAPRPIALVSTIDLEGNVNLSPFSFFNVFSSRPPIMVFSPAKKGKDTLINAELTREVVINIVNYSIVEQMSLSSTTYPRGVNEFVKSGLTQQPSIKVKPPRVEESPVSFECTVDRIISYGDEPGAGNLIFAKVELIHIREEYMMDNGRMDTAKLDLVARMGGSWYCRAIKDAMFEIPKPLDSLGIGVDSLPDHTRKSDILTGNNLGRLGNLPSTPSREMMDQMRASPDVKRILEEFDGDPNQCRKSLHGLAQQYIMMNEMEKALAIIYL
ncbi:MAG: flavin reductase family protein [Bacteroidia bacterium]|nr:flavin reductase family protein [Bacteroidia bacterium]